MHLEGHLMRSKFEHFVCGPFYTFFSGSALPSHEMTFIPSSSYEPPLQTFYFTGPASLSDKMTFKVTSSKPRPDRPSLASIADGVCTRHFDVQCEKNTYLCRKWVLAIKKYHSYVSRSSNSFQFFLFPFLFILQFHMLKKEYTSMAIICECDVCTGWWP